MAIHIAASGESSRMRADMVAHGMEDMPKHLLPLQPGSPQTLIGNNIRTALLSDELVVLHVSESNQERILGHQDVAQYLGDLAVHTDPKLRPLGPFTFMEPSVRSNSCDETQFSIAGDVAIEDFAWQSFMTDHARGQHAGMAVSFLAAYVDAPKDSAVFAVDEQNKILSLSRQSHARSNVLRNVGVYGFTPEQAVRDIMGYYLELAEHESNDVMVAKIINSGLAQAIEHTGYFANMNTLADYHQFIARTQPMEDVA